MWIVSRLNAFGLTAFASLMAGFFLGAHAVQADPNALVVVAALCLIIGYAVGQRRAARAKVTCLPNAPQCGAPPAPHDTSGIDDAISALRNLGLSAKEAKAAIAGAVAALGDDADVSSLIRAGLGKGASK